MIIIIIKKPKTPKHRVLKPSNGKKQVSVLKYGCALSAHTAEKGKLGTAPQHGGGQSNAWHKTCDKGQWHILSLPRGRKLSRSLSTHQSGNANGGQMEGAVWVVSFQGLNYVQGFVCVGVQVCACECVYPQGGQRIPVLRITDSCNMDADARNQTQFLWKNKCS